VDNVLADISLTSTPIDLTVDDSADTVGRAVSLSDTAISFGGPQIRYLRNAIHSLTLEGGSGSAIRYTVNDTPVDPRNPSRARGGRLHEIRRSSVF
jgi:hypothetical protein